MQRFERVGGRTGFICVILALLVTLANSVYFLPALRHGGLSNPDSYMRLVRLRDMLNSGTVLFTAARDGSGHGTVLHWSHLLDSLLYLLALPFCSMLNMDDALRAAALMFGPLNIAALAFAVVWAGAPFAERKWLFLGAVLVPLSPAIISYGVVGVVHHHVAIATAAVACWGWAARVVCRLARRGAGIALGAWMGVGVWLTPETVPLTMMAFGALWLAWILFPRRDDIAREIGLTGVSFALVTTLTVLVDPPAAGIGAMEIDRVSPVFAGLALAVAMCSGGMFALHRLVGRRGPRILAACLVAIACAGIWVASFRHAIFGADMVVDAAIRDAMFSHIVEMMPVRGALSWLHYLATGTLATLVAVGLAVRRRSWIIGYAALCTVALLVLGWSHVRFSAYPEAAGAIVLPIALTLAGVATAAWHQIGQSFTRLAIILLFVQVPYLGQLPDIATSAHAAPLITLPACDLNDAIDLLRPHPGAVALADVNDTPELLWKTQIRTVGSLYHRNMAGFLRLRDAWRVAPTATVPAEIDAAEIDLVLACRTPARSSLVMDLPGPTLLDQVRSGNPPPWLREIDENPVSGHVLYEVVRAEPGPRHLASVAIPR